MSGSRYVHRPRSRIQICRFTAAGMVRVMVARARRRAALWLPAGGGSSDLGAQVRPRPISAAGAAWCGPRSVVPAGGVGWCGPRSAVSGAGGGGAKAARSRWVAAVSESAATVAATPWPGLCRGSELRSGGAPGRGDSELVGRGGAAAAGLSWCTLPCRPELGCGPSDLGAQVRPLRSRRHRRHRPARSRHSPLAGAPPAPAAAAAAHAARTHSATARLRSASASPPQAAALLPGNPHTASWPGSGSGPRRPLGAAGAAGPSRPVAPGVSARGGVVTAVYTE